MKSSTRSLGRVAAALLASGLPKSQAKQKTQDYLAANPQVRDELSAIRQPGVDLRNRCNIPLKTEIASVI